MKRGSRSWDVPTPAKKCFSQGRSDRPFDQVFRIPRLDEALLAVVLLGAVVQRNGHLGAEEAGIGHVLEQGVTGSQLLGVLVHGLAQIVDEIRVHIGGDDDEALDAEGVGIIVLTGVGAGGDLGLDVGSVAREDLVDLLLGHVEDLDLLGGSEVQLTADGQAGEAEGRIEDANAMLEAPYCIDWPVRHGKGIGTSKLGKPTINQNYPTDALQPCTGVYLTRIWLDGRWWPSATGIGRRPTVDAANAPVTCETYVPGYHGDTYGQTPVLEFHHYLCAVRKFGTLQELADLIETAAQQSIAYFAAKEEA